MLVFVFFIFLIAWLCLPFVPGIIEIIKKTDSAPLKVVRDYDVDIEYFANSFRDYVKKHFSGMMTKTHELVASQGQLEDETQYFILNQGNAIPFNKNDRKSKITNTMLISTDSLKLPGLMSYLTEIYAADSITGGKEDIYRALLAENDIEIAEGSMVLRWMHAGHSINVKPRCVLFGRVSADESIHLTNDCHFERLHAATIQFGRSLPRHQALGETKKLSPEDIHHKVDTRGERWLIESNVTIPDHSLIDTNLVVVGKLTIGKNCRITGSVKSRKDLYIGAGSEITGSLVSNKNIICENDCLIAGPVISEEAIYLGSHSIIGSKEIPTTISAEEIQVTTNSVAFGSVWARQKGVVIVNQD